MKHKIKHWIALISEYLGIDLIIRRKEYLGIDLIIRRKDIHQRKLVILKPEGEIVGRALLALILEPFLLNEGEKVSSRHTNEQESLELSRVFLDLGYEVHVISKLRGSFSPKHHYDFYVNLRTNFEKISRNLNKDCIKIVHLDVSHWLFSNYEAVKRAFELRERRRIAISSFRHIIENRAIEHCDYATMLGNDFTISTYNFAGKKIYRTSLPTYTVYEWPVAKSFDTCKNRFLWFGSSGFVHKGLDLVLEIFSRNPQWHLTVCGPVDQDPEFKQAFYKELYETANIETLGWISVDEPVFNDIAMSHIAIVFPSCAEGSNGGVITCMQAGLIPVVSKQTGVNIDPAYGFLLKNTELGEIETTLNIISGMESEKLMNMAKNSWIYARNNNTIEAFHKDYKYAITDIIRRENKAIT